MGREGHSKQITLACARSAPAHGVCALPAHTAQALRCSAGNCPRPALGCMHLPGLSRSGSGTQEVLRCRLCWACIFCPSQVQEAQVMRCLVVAATPVPATWFSGCTSGSPSQADVDCPEPQEVLVSKEACLQLGRECLSGAAIAPFQPFWLWLPVTGGGWSAAG